MNNDQRELWINNDEGLYDWWKSTHLSMANFIKANRDEIDEAIHLMETGQKRPHYLTYG